MTPSQSTKVRWLGFNPAAFERLGHAAVLEIVRDIGDMPRFRDSRVGQPAPLVALGRGMIELEDPQILGPLNPIGEGVEARAEDEDLPHALSHRAAAISSAKRLRMAMKKRNGRRSGFSLASAIASSASCPRIASASGSAKTIPRSRT